MTKKQKKMLSRILISAVLFLLLYTVPAQGVVRLLLYLIPYAVIGWDVLWRAVKNIRNGQVFDENFLMSIATIGAFGCGEYPEAVAVMLFYQVGELFQSVAVGRSRQSIAALMDIRPDYANMERDGQLVQVDPDEVAVGDTIVIKAGERVPLHSHPGKQRAGYRRPHRGIPSPGRSRRRRCDLRLCQPVRPAPCPGHQALWGIHRGQDPGLGGEFQRKEGQGGTLYH